MRHKPPLELTQVTHSGHLAKDVKIDASIIWLHGLGADGYDFEPIVAQLNLPYIRFILPHANDMAITRNNGHIMPAWYDIYGITPITKEDALGIRSSQEYINSLIEIETNRGISSERIALAGFSQGGAIALQTALRYPQRLAAVLALSTYLPLQSKLVSEASKANIALPIFMAHGTFDDVITLEMCQDSLNLLRNQQFDVAWHQYNMAHSVCADEIDDIRAFLKHTLPQSL